MADGSGRSLGFLPNLCLFILNLKCKGEGGQREERKEGREGETTETKRKSVLTSFCLLTGESRRPDLEQGVAEVPPAITVLQGGLRDINDLWVAGLAVAQWSSVTIKRQQHPDSSHLVLLLQELYFPGMNY